MSEEEKINEIKEEISRLKQIKNQLEEKRKMSRRKRTIKPKNVKTNVLMRVSNIFNEKIILILNRRIENGKDIKFVSKPQITELIIKHKLWPTIEFDILNYNFGA